VDLAKVAASKCQVSPDDVEHARQETALGNTTYGPVSAAAVAATFRRDHPWMVAH
jgi:hypothetical protein